MLVPRAALPSPSSLTGAVWRGSRRWLRRSRCIRRRILVVPCPLACGMIISRLLPVLVQDAAPRQASLVALEPRLGQADETWVGDGHPSRVGHIGGNAHVDAHR